MSVRVPVHLILQGKGGVGKTFIAAMLAQYLARDGQPAPVCVDTDPVNQSFSAYEALQVRGLSILEGREVNKRKFDELVELLAESDRPAIVDNGAATFLPLSSYLLANEVLPMLFDLGRPVLIHTVVTGGQALLDTVEGFRSLVANYPAGSTIVVWLNPFWGPIELDGRGFETFTPYKAHKSRVGGIVQLPTFDADTFGRDLSEMLSEHLTFDQAIADAGRPIMVRQRLTMARRAIFAEVSKVPML